MTIEEMRVFASECRLEVRSKIVKGEEIFQIKSELIIITSAQMQRIIGFAILNQLRLYVTTSYWGDEEFATIVLYESA